jgi:hypothetical protein
MQVVHSIHRSQVKYQKKSISVDDVSNKLQKLNQLSVIHLLIQVKYCATVVTTSSLHYDSCNIHYFCLDPQTYAEVRLVKK